MQKSLFFLFIILFQVCCQSQNSGLEIFEKIPFENQERILKEINRNIDQEFLNQLTFEGKYSKIVNGDVSLYKIISHNPKVIKENWTYNDLHQKENQGKMFEYRFDKERKLTYSKITNDPVQVDDAITHFFYDDSGKINKIQKNRSEIKYIYTDSIVTIREVNDYGTVEIETHIKDGDSITVYYQYESKPKILKYEYLLNKDKTLSVYRHHHGSGVNNWAFFYNEKGQLVKYIQFEDHNLSRNPTQRKISRELKYYNFGAIEEYLTRDEINNTLHVGSRYVSFERNDLGNLIVRTKSKSQSQMYAGSTILEFDENYNLVFNYASYTDKEFPPLVSAMEIEYW